uniref:Peptidase M24 domain-containing protein n=1 Tax=Pan paniscus TaxID=9597 RepID=A0A2R9AT77_PANPA
MLGRDEQQEQTIAEDLEASSSGVLCEEGDAMIMAETGKIFKKEKEMKKSIAFPTSISVNNCVYCILKEGNLVKIDLGVHVDGFIANVAHTFVVDVAQGIQITRQKADVIKAAHLCVEAALCLVKPGNHNTQVTEAWNNVGHSFNYMPVEDMLSHQLKQHVIDGEKTVTQNPADQQKKDHEKLNLMFSSVERCFNALLFTLRAWMGVVECTKHGLLQLFNVLYEKKGESVDQFKFTVLLMPNGSMLITSGPFEPDLHRSEIEVQDPELKTLLQSSSS